MASDLDLRKSEIARLTRELLQTLGYEAAGDLARTPERVAELWAEHLVRPTPDLEALLSGGIAPPDSRATPIVVADIGMHLVCPHHLTVAFGRAHVAYLPGERLLGFGTIATLVERLTARLTLQERVTQDIADAIVRYGGGHAAAVCLHATHPCHNVMHPRSNDSTSITWAFAGDAAHSDALRAATETVVKQSR